MKRRLEEPKQDSSNSLASPAYLGAASRHQGASGNPLSSHPKAARILASSHSGTGVVQQTFSISKADSSSGSSMPGSVQHFSLSTAQQPTSFGGGAPPASAPTALAKGPNSGLQGGAPTVNSLQTQAHQQHTLHQTQAHQQLRHKVHTSVVVGGGANSPMPGTVSSSVGASGAQAQAQQHQFQRLKVEDALSYLDMVKFKFGNQPQVYNDFLDIMKEFKSQSIDTPGVIQRVSNLFKGHPELIVGFNTFLPPGYKIEVQANEQGYAFQVSVSMPSPTAPSTTMVHTPVSHHTTVMPSLTTPGLGSSPPPQVTLTSVSTSSVVTQPQAIKSPILQIVHSTTGSSSSHHNLSSVPTPNSHHPHHPSPIPNTAVAVVTTATQQQPPSLYQPAHTPPPSTPPISAAPTVSAGGGHHHHNNAHHPHHAATSAFAHQAVTQALSHVESGGGGGSNATPQSQPVEFNHAINYVNKIKNRFQGQPDKYKRFLEILHTYQKEQRNLKDGLSTPGKHLTEAEVYSQVAKLFENQEDLLAEFGQFLPDATSHQAALSSFVSQGTKSGSGGSDHSGLTKKPSSGLKPSSGSSAGYNSICPGGNLASSGGGTERPVGLGSKFGSTAGQVKRSPSVYSASGTSIPPPPKKHKMASLRDVSLAEACKYGSLNDYAFFDKARKALKNQDVYENFLRCLILFNQEVVSRSELVQLVTPFLGKFPELFRWFRDFIGHGENNNGSSHGTPGTHGGLAGGSMGLDPVPNSVARQDRPVGDLAMEIDYTTCKRLGASYCALPKTYVQPKSSGRTPLCKEVLNDSWVSFPTWSSEDSTFVTSRKTQYEEYIYRCEDERFELDVVIETNAATIRVLEGVHKKLSRLSPEEVAKFRLDENLGGTSPTIHQRALRRIYGDKAQDIIDGLKKNPVVAVPVVLRRLKAKEEEWREAQKGFNKLWREQNEKYYLKSLDHQGMNFKQNDVKALRSKSLFNEIETLYDERHEQAEEGSGEVSTGPHLVLPYKDKTVLDDAANLLIHHVKRQTGIHKEDKQRIKQLLRQLVPDMFCHPRQELSDDEREDEDEKEDGETEGCNGCPVSSLAKSGRRDEAQVKKEQDAGGGSETAGDPLDNKLPCHAISTHPDESYTLLFGNNHCYLFLRLHQILCERLTKMYEHAVTLAAEEARHQQLRNESAAVALRLKPKTPVHRQKQDGDSSCEGEVAQGNGNQRKVFVPGEIEVRDYYPAFLDMVKNVLDGNMDGSAYEDTLREMFGIHAYVAFTLDKVVTYAVRQLQNLVCDESCQECLDLLQQELRRGGAGGPCSTAHQRLSLEQVYQRRAEQALADENCFKIYVYKVDCKLTIELLDTEPEDPEPVAEVEKWSSYVESFANSGVDDLGAGNGGPTASEGRTDMSGDDNDDLDLMLDNLGQRKAVYLDRNVRLFRRRVGNSPGTPLDCKELLSHLTPPHIPNNKRPSTPPHLDEEGHEDSKDKSSSEDEKPALPLPHVNNNAAGSMVGGDMTECRFNINSYRMVFVVNKENFLYKRQSLPKAKEAHSAISTRLSSKFSVWHLRWASDNVTDLQQRACADWLMGRGEGVVPNRTRVLTDNDQGRPPYRSYNRYRVERLQQAGSGEISS